MTTLATSIWHLSPIKLLEVPSLVALSRIFIEQYNPGSRILTALLVTMWLTFVPDMTSQAAFDRLQLKLG